MPFDKLSKLSHNELVDLFANLNRVDAASDDVEACRDELRHRLCEIQHKHEVVSSEQLDVILHEARVRVAKVIAHHRGVKALSNWEKSTNTQWVHKKSGKRYLFEEIVLNEATVTASAVYSTHTTAIIKWVRPLDGFLERFRPYR